MNAEQALKKLMDGNARYLSQNMQNQNQDLSILRETVAGQNPFAAVLTCSDSRVLPQVIFDQGIGDIFLIRVAGTVIDDSVLGSIEYAAEYLDVRLILVLGHTNCGAITAALDGTKPAGNIAIITDAIGPAVEEAKLLEGDLLTNAIIRNTVLAAERIRTSPDIIDILVTEDKLLVVPAIYDLATGSVDIIEQNL